MIELNGLELKVDPIHLGQKLSNVGLCKRLSTVDSSRMGDPS